MMTTWLLGNAAPDEFAYGPYRLVRTDEDRWCIRQAEVEVTVCGRAIDPKAIESLEVFTTCPACGSTMAKRGQAIALPLTVAVDAARSYWRFRNEACRRNTRLLNEGANA
jgi:hypothetical protein